MLIKQNKCVRIVTEKAVVSAPLREKGEMYIVYENLQIIISSCRFYHIHVTVSKSHYDILPDYDDVKLVYSKYMFVLSLSECKVFTKPILNYEVSLSLSQLYTCYLCVIVPS